MCILNVHRKKQIKEHISIAVMQVMSYSKLLRFVPTDSLTPSAQILHILIGSINLIRELMLYTKSP